MLYVSRILGIGKYGVVDTDDNSEAVVSYNDIEVCYLRYGIEIKGAVFREKTVRGKTMLYLHHVEVYQDISARTKQQVKLRTFKGVDIKVFNDEITSISLDAGIEHLNSVVRLSDYGKKLNKYLFNRGAYSSSKLVTLILDDKIELNAYSLHECFQHGVALDVRECTNEKTLDYVCKELVDVTSVAFNLLDNGRIIASDNFIDYCKAIVVIERPMNTSPTISHISDIVRDPIAVSKAVGEKYKSKFIKASKANFSLPETLPFNNDTIEPYIKWLRTMAKSMDNVMSYYMTNNSTEVFKKLQRSHYTEIFGVMRLYSTYNYVTLNRFESFVKYFDIPTPELREAAIRFIFRANKWLLSQADTILDS